MWNCPTCDGKVAKSADKCPHCGANFGMVQKSAMQGRAIAEGKESAVGAAAEGFLNGILSALTKR